MACHPLPETVRLRALTGGVTTTLTSRRATGPVYSPRAYQLAFDELRETIAVCYVLLRICWPEFQLPTDLSTLLSTPLDQPTMSNWPDVARRVLTATFA